MGYLLLLSWMFFFSCSTGSILSAKKSTGDKMKMEEETAPSSYVDVSTLTEAAVSILDHVSRFESRSIASLIESNR